MRILYTIIIGVILSMISFSVSAVSAWPYPIEFTQPDGSKITIRLKGDEHTKWAETIDGFTILFNSKGFYEYAKLNADKELIRSEIVAKNSEERSIKDRDFLSTVDKHLYYSGSQVSYLKSLRQIYNYQAQKSFPTTGNRKLICILMGFPDLSFTKSKTDFDNLFNQINYSVDGATGSVKDYYKENSYNQLNLTVTIAGPYVADNNMAYYGANSADNDEDGENDDDANPKALITEAVQKANPDINYAEFDNDNNGSVDGVYVIFAGYGEEAGAPDNAIWSHAWDISALTLDGKTISSYSCSPELRGNSGSGLTRIGVICHEFGHVLGSPDYYDTNYEIDGQFGGTGYWDLMGSGSWNNNGATPAHHNAYTKTQIYHWASATTLSSPTTITMPNAENNASGFYIINTKTSGEYFICENRQKIGFDTNIPGHGLMIYHKHKDGVSNTSYPQMFYPVCASSTENPGTTSTTYGSINSSGCPFPGTSNKTSFTDVTTPHARSWLDANSNKSITNVSENNSAKTVTFSFMSGCTLPTVQASLYNSSDLTDNSMTIRWARGNGSSVLVIARDGGAVNDEPVNGTTYAANSVFGFGTQIGGGNYVVYDGLGTSVNISSLRPGVTYHYAVYEYTLASHCYLTPALTGSTKTTGTPLCTYCASSGTMNSSTGITFVNFNTINNVTSKPAAYNNYTGLITFVNKRATYNLTVNLNTAGNKTVHAMAWFDWNQDCDFLDIGETFDLGTAANTTNGATSLSPLSITIPATALTGYTQMRVSANYNTDPTSCGTAFNGEVEDYSINVTAPDPCYALNYPATKAECRTGNYVDLGSNGSAITTSNFDDANSVVQNIGFSFDYNCQTFTQFVLNTNGFIKLGGTAPSSASLFFTEANTANAGIFNSVNPLDINLISPFNHDLYAGTETPEYRVYTSGTAPNRVCTIQFKNVRDKTSNPAQQYNNMHFQIKLYETSAIVEFVYGEWTPSANASAFKTSACGLKGSSNAANQLLVVNKGSVTSWDEVSFSNANYSTTATLNFGNPTDRPKPDTGRTYRFIPLYNNDCKVGEIYALGDASRYYSNPQAISVNILNVGFNDLASIPVTLTVSGANSFTDTKYIQTLTYGDNETVTFADFIATSVGTTTISISLPNDGYSGNNTKSWTQNTNDFNLNYSSTEKSLNSWGWSQTDNTTVGASGVFYSKYRVSGSANVISIKTYIANNAASVGKTVYGLLLNFAGTIIGQSDNYVIQAGDLDGWHTFSITAPPIITDAVFYAGFACVAGSTVYYAMGSQSENPLRENTFFTSNLDGSSLMPKDPLTFTDRYMIGATLASVPPVAGVAASNSPICIGNPATLSLTGYRGTIQWQQSADGTTNWINVSGGTGASSASYTTINLTTTISYRAQVTQPGYTTLYSNVVTVIVNRLPANAGAISGATIVCRGQNSVTYSVPLIANATIYNWTLPTGVSGTSTTNSITVDYSTSAISGNITVKGHNLCGDGTASSLAIVVETLSGNAGTITGSPTVCQGQNSVEYSVPVIVHATSYIWTLPTGATGTSSTNSITVNFGKSAISGNISVKGHNSCGDGVASTLAITVNPLPANAGAISGSTTVCQGQNSVEYSVPVIVHATSYIWTLPTGATGTSSTNSITVNFGKSAISGNISVKGHNTCGDGVATTMAITVNPLPANAGAISGTTTVCQGQNSVEYSVPVIVHATSYIWSLPTGATGTSSTNSITVNFGKSAISGNISVKGHNSCGDGVATTMAIIVNPLPANAGAISGITTVCQGQNMVRYTISTISNATSYNWILPTGATGTSTTNSIDVNYSMSAVSGNITVNGHNSCGDGEPITLAINVETLPTNAGAISGNISVCQEQSLVKYSIPVIANATSYNWTMPTGATGTSTTNSIDVNYGVSSLSGNMTVKGINFCGEGVSSSLTIVVNAKPSSPTITRDGNTLHSSIPSGNQWYNQNGIINGATNQNFNPPAKGDYYSILTSGGCSSDPSATFIFIPTGIELPKTNNDVKVFPNPVSNELVIEVANNKEKIDFEIINSIGQVVYKGALLDKAVIQTDHFTPGVYLVKLGIGGFFEFRKIVKE